LMFVIALWSIANSTPKVIDNIVDKIATQNTIFDAIVFEMFH
jgi:hypothetical protein